MPNENAAKCLHSKIGKSVQQYFTVIASQHIT